MRINTHILVYTRTHASQMSSGTKWGRTEFFNGFLVRMSCIFQWLNFLVKVQDDLIFSMKFMVLPHFGALCVCLFLNGISTYNVWMKCICMNYACVIVIEFLIVVILFNSQTVADLLLLSFNEKKNSRSKHCGLLIPYSWRDVSCYQLSTFHHNRVRC